MINWQRLRDTTGVSILLEIGSELGMSIDSCLARTRIDPNRLDDPLASIPVWQELALIRNIQAFRSSDEQLGLMVARRCTASTMGMFGQALAASDTLQQARQLMERYELLGLAFSRFEFSTTKHQLCMTLHDFEVPADCQRFCEERGLGGCLVLFSDLLGAPVKAKTVSMRLPPPADADVYSDYFGVDVQYEAQNTEITFDRAIEQQILPNANRKIRLASERYCDEVIAAHALPMTFEARVQELLQNHDLALDLEEVAQHLGMSSRQLRRYLTGESTNFRQILLKLKFTRAQALLEAGMPVSQVALQLGYTSAASFSRAFKKQTGIAPKFVNKTG